jgi:hypothetical protein
MFINHIRRGTQTAILKSFKKIIAVVLVIGWAICYLGLHVAGGLIHALLVIAVVLVIINLITGRKSG